ncbi:ABC transporter ATP-binding protein [Actinorhabdospora filicis]|uniref:ABC transporter ATP-binding protein n=1 Tax=Actinorhabdospora filicis TaxID=1785913 RepID=A0A9W6SRB3_9ACTN|nr:ATP-binding cassette domain-containing protein [Actinorhabdospora filicis]GLZ80432.1 ABC transporter ATP-binding protein [Actinorhabdospora filicis]
MMEIDGLRKSYGAKVALDGVTFTVRDGEMFGFVGANGAGKTTTMRIAMGVLNADAGEVRFGGHALAFDDRRRFGYMPEERGLYPKMKIGDQVAYFGELHGMTPAAAKSAAASWLERLGLSERAGDHVQDLSLGNQQRVQLAVALVHDPEVLILDEPFSGLDPLAVDTMADVLAERNAAGVPVIFSSHQLDLVERICDSVGIIAAGKMVAVGTVDELRRREGHRILKVEVADAAPGWEQGLPGRVVGTDDDALLIETTDDQAVLKAAMNAGRVGHFGWQEPTLVEIFREAVA